MVPRPRKKANRPLPPNLYIDPRYGTYRYRRPDNGTWHRMGKDKAAAIEAAKQLNAQLMAGSDLVATVMGGGVTLGQFIETYERDILPPRKLAKATLDLYAVRLRGIKRELGEDTPIESITLRQVSAMLDKLTPRASNQCRALLIDMLNHAKARGLIADNPAADTIPRIEEKQRKRHTVEGLMAIRAASPIWLQNAIDLALLTGQRREDILAMRFEDIRDGYLYLVQKKTAKASDSGYLRLRMTPAMQEAVRRCRDDVASPYLIHRRPDRLDAKQRAAKAHWTQVDNRFLSRAFQEAREAAQAYPGWKDGELPGFHEVRALAKQLYNKQGKTPEQVQQLLGHADIQMTRNYGKDHHEIVWTDVEPDLDLSKLTG